MMEKAAVSQSIRNWKLLSDLKKTASSVYLKGEEVGSDLSVFSKQNLYPDHRELPAYERLINRISFNKPDAPIHFTKRFSLFGVAGNARSGAKMPNSRRGIGTRALILFISICVLAVLLIIFL